MSFAKRPRDIIKGMTVKQLKEFLTGMKISFPRNARKAELVVIVIRFNRPRIIRNNYGGLNVTPRQARRIRKAKNRAEGMAA